MTWARPDLLALVLLVPFVLLLVIVVERRRRRDLERFAAFDVLPSLVSPGVRRARTLQAALSVLASAGLALAAAGPRLGFEWQQQKVEGVSIVVVLDVSRSMDAQDVTPSRLERARREIFDLLALLRGDAVGLVIFAAGPYVRIPLTVDYDTFAWAVKDSSSDTIRAQGSALSGALDAATGLLGKAPGTGKAVVVVSDGEAHDEPEAIEASLDRAREAGVRVYALGVGEPGGAPIPLADGGFKKDTSGNVVLSRLDESALQRLAAGTGGAYVRAVSSDDDVRALYEGEIRGKLDVAERGMRREKLWQERFQWPLAAALLALVISSAAGVGRRGVHRAARAAAAFALVAWVASPGPAWAGAAEDGAVALRAQEWSRAAELLGQARVEDPSDLGVARGLAEALYRAGRYREAEQLFETLATQDPDHEAVHLYNAGNAAYRGGRLADALSDFRGAVAADANLKAAQTNATAVERELAARSQPPPPEESEGSQGEQGEDAQAGEEPQGGQPGEDGQADAGGEQPAGEQPKAGDQGEPGDQQGGEPQDGDRQGGEQQGGEQQGGEPSAQPGQPDGTSDGGRRDGAEPGGAQGTQGSEAALSEDGAEGESAIEGAEGEPSSAGGMTREQAARLVDSVPDGKPRVVVGGRGGEEDW